MHNNFILRIYSLPQSVFTLNELSLLFPEIAYPNLRKRMHYFTKVGKLKRLHQGIYAKSEYNPLELANKLYKPSYISLETVLVKAGVVFQYYERIFAVSYLTREVKVNDSVIQYRQIKRGVLTNMQGIESSNGYFIATPERAFLDAIYIYKDYHFDNLGTLNWDNIFNLQTIYKSGILNKRVKQYYKDYQKDYVK
ncbi:MAG TPA: hypothetical protein VMR77_00455 [Patescibacteria group bacterium]|jgi:hypothetical protein|nr:hypothetical protein [Patescibacteria group bacterium]